ncbi:MAG: NADP-dependent malic enzyme [Alphaproteobacteria bacterium]|nr:NADP-dependent malic enzyme [Alphaproteobacteria bacterium]
MADELRESALQYHRAAPAGKLAIQATKPLANQRDLALAYSPGVAAACDAIAEDPSEAATLTARGNLVAVISNGTAVLGLGAIGALAAKPVMEGKAVLFKKFAGIDVFDIEVDERDPDKLVDIIASLEPTFGGINLEDIKAPECFEVEGRLKERCGIPVFHDDQHGTAIIVNAAILNALRLVKKPIESIKLVVSGAGAAALACLDLLRLQGVKLENIWVSDVEGVVYKGRKVLMDPRKSQYAQKTDARTLDDIIDGADIFLGLSAPNVLKPDQAKRMAKRPIILALANPVPEILPEEVAKVRKDAIMATGRSDYPNQVNNVLCFPYIFRGALDVGATTINEEMKLACVRALADLALAEPSDVAARAYGGQSLMFGPDYLIPRPFDPRLIVNIAPAVAKAAMETGVATRPIEDFDAYEERLNQFVFRSGLVMKPVFELAKTDPKRIAFAEGEEDRVLHAVQVLIDEGLAKPILIGRRSVVKSRIKKLGLRFRLDRDVGLCDPEDDPRYADYSQLYHGIMSRKGVSPDFARTVVRTDTTVIAALMVRRGEADGFLCGTIGRYRDHLDDVLDVIGKAPGIRDLSALSLIILPQGTYFICDTYVTPDPSAEELAEMAILSARHMERFGIVPKIALVSHSNFGSRDTQSARKVREAAQILTERAPDLEADGEMHADAALNEEIRNRIFPDSQLKGQANLLVMPDLDAANIALNMLKTIGDALSVGPILLGTDMTAHILTPSVTVRGIVNMGAMTVVDAQSRTRADNDRDAS